MWDGRPNNCTPVGTLNIAYLDTISITSNHNTCFSSLRWNLIIIISISITK